MSGFKVCRKNVDIHNVNYMNLAQSTTTFTCIYLVAVLISELYSQQSWRVLRWLPTRLLPGRAEWTLLHVRMPDAARVK